MSVLRQNPDGTWSPADPMGWQEEHGPVARLILWLLRRPHCNDEAMRRLIARSRCDVCCLHGGRHNAWAHAEHNRALRRRAG